MIFFPDKRTQLYSHGKTKPAEAIVNKMSSRFVSAGAIDAASGEAVELDPSAAAVKSVAGSSSGGTEWEIVQRELEAERKRRDAAAEAARRGEGQEMTLYEVLQANKGRSCPVVWFERAAVSE